MVAINGRSILDTLNVDKAFMGTNSLSLKHGACVADIMLAETKRGMVEHASQVIIVCDYSKLNNTSLAQFTTTIELTRWWWIVCLMMFRRIVMPAFR